MDRILFHMGPVTVYTFGASIAMGALIAFWLADREAKRLGIDTDQISTLSMMILVAGILGARIFFVMFYDPLYYWQHPLDIFKIYEGGLSIHGGILGAVLIGLWYTRKTALPFWAVADVLAPAALLGQGIARVGCDVYGKVMAAAWPWGVQVQGQLVHPVQIYETLLDLALFIFLWGKRERQRYEGQIFIYYLGGYALIRLILEFFRTNPIWIGILTPAHLTSILFITIALGMDRWHAKYGFISAKTQKAIIFWVNPRVWTAIIILASASLWIFYAINR